MQSRHCMWSCSVERTTSAFVRVHLSAVRVHCDVMMMIRRTSSTDIWWMQSKPTLIRRFILPFLYFKKSSVGLMCKWRQYLLVLRMDRWKNFTWLLVWLVRIIYYYFQSTTENMTISCILVVTDFHTVIFWKCILHIPPPKSTFARYELLFKYCVFGCSNTLFHHRYIRGATVINLI